MLRPPQMHVKGSGRTGTVGASASLDRKLAKRLHQKGLAGKGAANGRR
jgi:hypothetical protein